METTRKDSEGGGGLSPEVTTHGVGPPNRGSRGSCPINGHKSVYPDLESLRKMFRLLGREQLILRLFRRQRNKVERFCGCDETTTFLSLLSLSNLDSETTVPFRSSEIRH